MAIQTKTPTTLYFEIINELTTNGITVSADPTLDGITSVLSDKMSELYNNQSIIFDAYRLANAGGRNLDDLGRAYGLIRYTSSAVSDTTLTNFNFYLPNGKTASDYATDPTQPITIPAGIMIRSDDWTFYTSQAAIIQPGENSAFVPITASNRSSLDIIAGSLVTHDIVLSAVDNLNLNSNPIILCTNNKTIPVLPESESDSAFRVRLFTRIQSMNNTNEDAITLALTAIGITNVSYRRNLFGTGTLGVEVSPEYALVSDNVYDAVDAILQRIAPNARAIRPDYLPCAICLALRLKDYTQQTASLASITSVIYDYINELPLGATLDLNTLNSLASADDNVTSVKFVTMKIDGRRVSLSNQTAAPTEKFVIRSDGLEFKL